MDSVMKITRWMEPRKTIMNWFHQNKIHAIKWDKSGMTLLTSIWVVEEYLFVIIKKDLWKHIDQGTFEIEDIF